MTLSAAEELEAMKAHDHDAPSPPHEAWESGTDSLDSEDDSQASQETRVDGRRRKRGFEEMMLRMSTGPRKAEVDLRQQQRRQRRRRTNNSKVEEEEEEEEEG